MRPARPVLTVLAAVTLGLGLLQPTPAPAQGGASSPASPGTATPADAGSAPSVDVVAPAPPGPPAEFGFEPTRPPDQPREQQFYPERTRSIHDPAFVAGANTTVRTSSTSGARIGLSGWTAPRVPFDFRESSGGLAFGLSIVWGVPLAEERQPPAPTGQR
jgi:hypothetical protein